MKNLTLVFAFLPALLLRAAPAPADQSLSPYFLIKALPGVVVTASALPLQSTQVKTTIAGVIADVTVTQTYANSGTVPLEAIYVFPGSTRAAVHGLTLQVGERRIVAQIKKRDEARKTYEAAKAAGQTASLLEQHRPNIFQMSVANILPGDVVQVELRYTELLVPEDGTYTFVYPGVVGPRCSSDTAPAATPEPTFSPAPALAEADPAAAPRFTFDLTLAPGLPIADASCPTHPVLINRTDFRTLQLALDPAAPAPENRDVIFNYRLAGATIQPGLIISEGADEKFFLLQLQPPARPDPAQIPPRDYLFVVDISGSMHGFPLNTARRLMADLFAQLRPSDSFNVLLFAGSNTTLAPASVPATPENIARAFALLGEHRGAGSTELLPALRAALALPVITTHTSRIITVVTDGYVECEPEAFDLVRQNLNRANLFAFGIGSSVNRHLIEGLARAGQGEPFIVTSEADAPREALRFRDMILSPVLTHMEISFDGFDAYDVEPVLQPDLLANRPIIAFGKWRGPRTGQIRVEGLLGGKLYTQNLPVATAQQLPTNSALSHLWARSRIAELSDYVKLRHDDARIAQITDLGLKYSLLTKYTSFIAVDQPIRRATTDLVTTKQPVALPTGMNNNNGGQEIPTSPEPGTLALLIVAAAVGLVVYLRRHRQSVT